MTQQGVDTLTRQLGEQIADVEAVNPERLIATVVIIAAIWIARFLLLRLVRTQSEDVRLRYRWRKFSSYGAVVLAVIVLGRVWFEGFPRILTFLGLVSAGIAIALRDMFVSLAGWVFILSRRPFVVGDRIQIGEHAGDVIDLRIFQFTLLEIGNWVSADQSTGRVIHVPNGRIFQDPIANFTRGFKYIWNEVPVLVTFESDWRKAKEILLRIATEHGGRLTDEAEQKVLQASRRFMIFYSNLTPTVYTQVRDSGVLLTIRYLTAPRQRRGTEQAIWEEILAEFGKADDIDFAYPTRRFYDNLLEGKPGARAEPPES
ncbi:MAG: mechanosensitive ion channel family protein [Gemmatimonadota bacterium]